MRTDSGLSVASQNTGPMTAGGQVIVTADTGCQTEQVISACIQQMEELFCDVLASSNLSEEQKTENRTEYGKYVEELKRAL